LKKKILVLGSTGMLGHQVVKYFKKLDQYDLYDISYRNKLTDRTIIIDVRKITELEKYIIEVKPDIIINCIGMLIEESQEDISKAIYINSYFPHLLKSICNKINAKLVHISTDCVFSGDKGSYTETDLPDSNTIYGKTKSLGEITDNTHVTIRTSIIGPELKSNGVSLLDWFLKEKNSEINGYSKAIWSGVTTLELAKIIKIAIDSHITGLYHVTNNEKISKYELLKLFNNHINKKFKINKNESIMNNKSLIDTRNKLNYTVPNYNIMIEEMFKELFNNPSTYKHYNIF
tara:strand:+ start:2994 stop:3860 length:867 start_codon:yes stop_codon:yes gene_type:complete